MYPGRKKRPGKKEGMLSIGSEVVSVLTFTRTFE